MKLKERYRITARVPTNCPYFKKATRNIKRAFLIKQYYMRPSKKLCHEWQVRRMLLFQLKGVI